MKSARKPANSRQIALLGAGLATLLVLVAIATVAYRPLRGDAPAREPSGEFVDYFLTVFALLMAATACFLVYQLLTNRYGPEAGTHFRLRIGLPGVLFVVAVVLLIAQGRELFSLSPFDRPSSTAGTGGKGKDKDGEQRARPHEPEFRWPAAVVVTGLAAGAIGLAVMQSRSQRRAPRGPESLAEELADVLSDTLDDLRAERDPRAAVIAAYARMERLLAARGLERDPSEAPLEYLERTLVELDVPTEPVATLTRLFEYAKFSAHDIDPALKREAIEALTVIRDELRGSS